MIIKGASFHPDVMKKKKKKKKKTIFKTIGNLLENAFIQNPSNISHSINI